MTTSSKHTPGPWTINAIPSPVYGSDGSLVATGIGIGDGISAHIATVTGKRAAQNAALIAAAPELVAALESALIFKHAVAYALSSRPETQADWNRVCEQARAALAKAGAS